MLTVSERVTTDRAANMALWSSAPLVLKPKFFDNNQMGARYQMMRDQMGIGYHQYNLGWIGMEHPTIPPSANPINCPTGFISYPNNEDARRRLGFHAFHCYSQGALRVWDRLFRIDKDHGMQTGVVIAYTPEQFRHPNCTPFDFGASNLLPFCFPTPEGMDALEDYVNLLASRYNGQNANLGNARVRHFIMWNENAAGTWANFRGQSSMNADSTDLNYRAGRLANVMVRAHRAIKRHQTGAMLYFSTDSIWEATPEQVAHDGHLGTKRLLDRIWDRLGTSIDWSLAIHPYGAPNQPAAPRHYNYYSLDFVHQYQVDKLKALGQPVNSPQSYMIASEQGWPLNFSSDEQRAQFVCRAHDTTVIKPYLIASAHNYFHQQPGDNGATQGDSYALIPSSIPASLNGVQNHPIGRAYISSHPNVFKKSDTHYCCSQHQIGCRSQAASVRRKAATCSGLQRPPCWLYSGKCRFRSCYDS